MEAEPNQINPEYLLPGTMVGPWEVVDLLGKGGFGVAYKVRRDGRYYALKLTLYRAADLGADERDRHEARVRRECGILLQLTHPNIVRVHGFERWPDMNDGYLYIVMDLVNGQRLYTWRERSVPSLRRICYVFQRIALALAEAHSRGAFHRDIKSENILVGIQGEPILIDWGIARSHGAVTVTRDHAVVGTHSHLPPEYCRYIDYDAGAEEFAWTPQSELHSVGYVFYELLTARSPFNLPAEDSTSDQNVIIQRLQRTTEAIKSVTPALPSLINPKVPGVLDGLVMKLLEKNPVDRYTTGSDLAQALDQALADADPSWDEPFDVPPPASRSAPTGGGRPAPAMGAAAASQPEMLPALSPQTHIAPAPAQDAPSPSDNSLGAPARSPNRFRAPTSNLKPFEPPEDPGEHASQPQLGALGRSSADAVQLARARLARQTDAPSRISRPQALVAILSVASLATAGVLWRSQKSAPAVPESLLRKVERASASSAPTVAPGSSQHAEDNTSSGLPPMAAPSPKPKETAAATKQSEKRPALPPTLPDRSAQIRNSASDDRVGQRRRPTAPAPRAEQDSALEFGQRLGAEANASSVKTPTRYRVQTGARIRARLDINLDSRTVGAGPAVARLARAYISEGRVVFPAGTMAYGEARSATGRFTVKFSRLVLPDKTEVAFEGLAYDLQDRKPGLAPSRRIAVTQQREGTAAKVGRVVTSTVLTAVSGGLAQDAARNAAETALNNRDSDDSAAGGDALLLDTGAEMDVLVTKPF